MTDNNIIVFIRDRFDSLETKVTEGFKEVKTNTKEKFDEHDDRIRTLEDEDNVKKGKAIAHSAMGGGLVTLVGWILIKVF